MMGIDPCTPNYPLDFHKSPKIVIRCAGDPPILIAGSQLTKQVLGWLPKHSQLEQIIHDTWQSIKNIHTIPHSARGIATTL